MSSASTPGSQMDPWSTGTRGYRVCLILGMTATFAGIIAVIIAAISTGEGAAATLRSAGLILIGVGLASHVIGIGLRKRQALQITRGRRNQQ